MTVSTKAPLGLKTRSEDSIMFDEFNEEFCYFIQEYIEDNDITLGIIVSVLLHNSLYALCKDQSLDDTRKGISAVMSAFADILTQLEKCEEKEIGYDWFKFVTNGVHLRHTQIRPEEGGI